MASFYGCFFGDKKLQGKDTIRFYDNGCNNVLNLRFYETTFGAWISWFRQFLGWKVERIRSQNVPSNEI
jgi:hypothetical protein